MTLQATYTTTDVAAYLRCTPHTLYAYVKKGKASPIRLGREYRWTQADVDALEQALRPAPKVTPRRRRRRAA